LETCRTVEGIADFIADRYRSAVEIGIGHFPDLAYDLLRRGVRVFATDIRPFRYAGLHFVIDDITEPDLALYRQRELIYSLRTPAELVPYMKRLAERVSADLLIRPLADEYIEGWKLIRNGNAPFFLMKHDDHL
jgi:hypothetical protein